MEKLILVIFILVFTSNGVQASQMLENSIWGSAAAYAGINVDTLYGIAVQESGMRWDDGSFRPWPWTLYINKGNKVIKAGSRRYASKQAAEQALTELIQQGIRNVDVGLMQVNLYWHGNEVPNDLALLDPRTNINVAAKYLKGLNTQSSNIRKTVAGYHAPTNPSRGNTYVNLVRRYEKIIHEKLH